MKINLESQFCSHRSFTSECGENTMDLEKYNFGCLRLLGAFIQFSSCSGSYPYGALLTLNQSNINYKHQNAFSITNFVFKII